MEKINTELEGCLKSLQNMFSLGIELGTFCVLDRCDDRYTTKTRQTIHPRKATQSVESGKAKGQRECESAKVQRGIEGAAAI